MSLNYSQIAPFVAEGKTDAEIVALVNVLPSRWRPLASKTLLAWSGENGRLRKLKAFAKSDVPAGWPAEQAAMYGLVQNAVDAFLLLIDRHDTEMEFRPGSAQRQLVDGAVALGVLTVGDVAPLIAAAKLVPDVVESDVTAVREAYAAQKAAEDEAEAARQAEEVERQLRASRVAVLNNATGAAAIALEQGGSLEEAKAAFDAAWTV